MKWERGKVGEGAASGALRREGREGSLADSRCSGAAGGHLGQMFLCPVYRELKPGTTPRSSWDKVCSGTLVCHLEPGLGAGVWPHCAARAEDTHLRPQEPESSVPDAHLEYLFLSLSHIAALPWALGKLIFLFKFCVSLVVDHFLRWFPFLNSSSVEIFYFVRVLCICGFFSFEIS